MKNKESENVNYILLNSFIKISKKCVDVLFILLIVSLLFIIGKLLIDWKILKNIINIINTISPIFIGFIIAWLLNPIVCYLEKKGIKRNLSTFITFFVFVLTLIIFFFLLIPEIIKQVQDAIKLIPNILNSFNNSLDNLFSRLSKIYDYDFKNIKDSINTTSSTYLKEITENLPKLVINISSNIISKGLKIVIGLIISFYMLIDFKNIRVNTLKLLPKRINKLYNDLTLKIDKTLKSYVLGTIVVTITLFIFQSLGFLIAGLKAPLVFGIICAVTNIIPYIGPYIGGIPAVLVGFTMSPLVGVLTLISVIVSQLIESYILTPVILSKTMKLHPITIIIGLLLFNYYFGVLGLIISTPIISCIKIVLRYINEKYNIIEIS